MYALKLQDNTYKLYNDNNIGNELQTLLDNLLLTAKLLNYNIYTFDDNYLCSGFDVKIHITIKSKYRQNIYIDIRQSNVSELYSRYYKRL